MRVVWIDADVSGTSTIQPLIDSGQVQAFPCPRFKDAEGVMWGLVRGTIKADMVVTDTIDRIAHVARQDIVIDPAAAKTLPIWENRTRLKATRDDYYATQDTVNRFITPLLELPIPVVFISHEAQREDPLTHTVKFGPNLQKGIHENLMTIADAILRLYPNPVPFPDGNGAHVPAGARILLMSANSDSAAGVRSATTPPPYQMIYDNDTYSFARFVQAVGRVPHVTVLYGPPKIGKTRFISTAVNMS